MGAFAKGFRLSPMPSYDPGEKAGERIRASHPKVVPALAAFDA